MLRTLLIVICLGLTACGSSPVSPRDIQEAQTLCASHGGLDTITGNIEFPDNTSFDATCIDGVEIHYHQFLTKGVH